MTRPATTRPATTVVLALAATAWLAGCTTPYPNGTPFAGATLDGNAAPRGSAAFCDTYAQQTAANDYETNRDSDSGSGYNDFQARRAERQGRIAYERCLAGRAS